MSFVSSAGEPAKIGPRSDCMDNLGVNTQGANCVKNHEIRYISLIVTTTPEARKNPVISDKPVKAA